MKLLRYFLPFITLLFIIFLPLNVYRSVNAQQETQVTETAKNAQKTEVVVFVREGCKHCADEEKFLTDLTSGRVDVYVTYKRLENPDDRTAWDEFTKRLGISKVTPLTVVGTKLIIGFDRASTTGEQIINFVDQVRQFGTTTDLSKVVYNLSSTASATCPEDGSVPCVVEESSPYIINLPIFGSFNANSYPLAVISAILGFIDGFNPCAMWVLVTFLLILIQVGSRKKMLLFAGTFVLAETIMYYFILTVWFKTWDFVQLDQLVTPIVGLVAIGSGIFFLREWRQKELECKVTNLGQRHRTHKKIEELALAKFSFLTFLGILALAFSVNIIEFACSIGIPQTFTKILELNNLGFWKSNLFILIYIFFYMIDDFIVFGIALWGIDRLSLTTKYSKLSNLIGGVLMIILGIILIFKPSLFLF